jgi:uncharacterized protein (TIGR00369 family)
VSRAEPSELREIPLEQVPAFNRTLGMFPIRLGGGRAEVDVEMREEFTNKRGVAHGGLITSLLDSAMGAAVVSGIRPDEWCGTVQLNIQFLGPGLGPRLQGRGWLVKRGRHVAFARGEIVNAEGEVIATGEGTWYVWPHRPLPASGNAAAGSGPAA